MITRSEWADPELPGITHRVGLWGDSGEVVWELYVGDRCLRQVPGWISGGEAADEWVSEWRAEGRDAALAKQIAEETGYTEGNL
jgi:hypothetical protein